MSMLPSDNFQIITVKNPFNPIDREISTAPLVSGNTLLAIRNVHFPQDVEVVVSRNGAVVPKDELHLNFPAPGDQIVFMPAVQGNDGNQIAMIAVMIAAAYTGGLAGGLGTFAGAMAATATAYGGAWLVNHFMPYHPQIPTATPYSTAYGWSPMTTQRQGDPIPRWYGTNKIMGNIIAAFVDNHRVDTEKSYANLLIALGVGPVSNIRPNSFKINDQPSGYFPGVKIEARRGDMDQSAVNAFNTGTPAESVPDILVQHSAAYEFTTPDADFDELEAEIQFPSGLVNIGSDGSQNLASVEFKVEFKLASAADSTYTSMVHQVLPADAGSPSTISTARWSLGKWIHVKVNAAPYLDKWGEEEGGTVPDTDKASHREGDHQWVDGWGDLWWHWLDVGDQYYSPSTTVTKSYTATGNSTQLKRHVFKTGRLNAKGIYKIRITRVTADAGSQPYSMPHPYDEMHLYKVSEIYDLKFTYPRLAYAAVRALATDQLSGSFNFSCVMDGAIIMVPTDSGGATWASQFSNNPAWVCWDILTRPVLVETVQPGDYTVARYDGIDPSRLVFAKFYEWAGFCDEMVPDGKGGTEKRITFNGGFDTDMAVWESALQVCLIGRAMLIPSGFKISVAIDKPSTPVQLFTVGNIGMDSFKERFLAVAERANEIEVDFINSENLYKREKFTAFNATTEPARKASLNLFGITKPSEAWRAGMYRLALNQYLLRAGEFQADIDAIVCQVGDVVNLQHDVPQWGEGGRLVAATSGTVTLDKPVTVEAGKTYSIMVRLSDDTLVSKTITNSAGTYTVLNLSSTFTTVPAQYDVYSFGELAPKPVRITNIQRNGDLKAVLSWVEYNASIYGLDSGLPALPTINYSTIDTMPAVTGVTLAETVFRKVDGSVENNIEVKWTLPAAGGLYVFAEIWFSIGSGWVLSGSETADRHIIKNVLAGQAYTVAVRTVNTAGQRMDLQQAPKATLTPAGGAGTLDTTHVGIKSGSIGARLEIVGGTLTIYDA